MNTSQAMGPYMDLGISPQWVSMLQQIIRLPRPTAASTATKRSPSGDGKMIGGIRLFGASNTNTGREEHSKAITEESDVVHQVPPWQCNRQLQCSIDSWLLCSHHLHQPNISTMQTFQLPWPISPRDILLQRRFEFNDSHHRYCRPSLREPLWSLLGHY